jgi:hypothetical protein
MADPTKQSFEFLSWIFSDLGKAAIAGALGGLVRWVTLKESKRDGFTSLVVGGICAIYLGPLVEPLLEPVLGKIAPDGDAAGFSSFVVGLGGISIAGFILDVIRMRRSSLEKPHVEK